MKFYFSQSRNWLAALLATVTLAITPLLQAKENESDIVMTNKTSNSGILAIFAHPDDETWINGFVAWLAAKVVRNHTPFRVIYVTSGDAGQDVSGRGLSGEELAREREQEAKLALLALGVQEPPIFLRLPDSKLQEPENQAQLQVLLNAKFQAFDPDIILTFGEDGITGHTDHKLVGIAARRAADVSGTPVVLNITLSKPRADALNRYAAEMGIDLPSIYPTHPVDPASVDLTINVGEFANQRIEAFAQHKTQFPAPFNMLWQQFVSQQSQEEIIVSRSHNKKPSRKPKSFHSILRDPDVRRGTSLREFQD